MKNRKVCFSATGVVCGLATLLLFAVGCDLSSFLPKTQVTTVFTVDPMTVKSTLMALFSASKAYVPMSDIQSLTVTITEVSLDRAGHDENGQSDDSEDGDAEANDHMDDNGQDETNNHDGSGHMDTKSELEDAKSKVIVFSGALDVNLLDLQGVSQALSTEDIPAGKYTKIRISIENPRLVLASDPNTVLTNVQLAANGQLFISQQFELVEGQDNLIMLNFGGIHLEQLGNGDYLLTPQLQVELNLESTDVVATGKVKSVDLETDMLVVKVEDNRLNVNYTGAAIYLPTDTDTATGTEADFAVGQRVYIEGTVGTDGTLIATSVDVLPPHNDD